jgi:LuxR family maltose regulon positive regulatory protein
MDAVDLARRARRHEALVGLVKRHWWDIAAADVATLAESLAEIPPELLVPRSALLRHLAELIPDRVIDQPIGPIDTIPVDDDELRARAGDPDATVLLDGIMIALMAARFRGERAAAREEVRRGMVMVAAMAPETQHDLPASIRRFFVQAGLVHLLDLDLPAAELAFRRGYGPDRHESPDVLRREAANKLALVSALRGDHAGVRAWVRRSDAIDPPTGWLAPNIEAPRQVAEAVVALDRLDRDEAEHQLAELSSTISTDELWFLELTVRAAAAVLWGGGHAVLHRIQLARVERSTLVTEGTLAQAQLDAWEAGLLMALGHGTQAEALLAERAGAFRTRAVRARLLHLSGRSREALSPLASVTQTPHDYSRVRVEALLLTAQVHHELGDAETARTYLGRATAHPELVSTFASVPRALLDEHVEGLPELAAIIAEIDRREPIVGYPEAIEVVVLTERERQLLELLPTSRSRDSIAQSLFVSTNTIKTQLQALYRKLGVKTRDDVVARAYELGLLR